jgi:polysaccharide export outer membrane protein
MPLLIFLIAVTAGASMQTAPQPQSSPEYLVGPQDRLSITVFDEPTLTKLVTVGSDGTFDYPFIGIVKAGGLTLRAIQQDITARLKKDFLRNPQVSVEVESYRSQVVYVWGQVRTPGAVMLSGTLTVSDALARAGSPTPDAGAYIEINRRARGSSPPADPASGTAPGAAPAGAERISMADIQSGRAQHITLSDGDSIFVPKAETFFVTGYVRNGGPFIYEPGMTVARALSIAGGVTEKGSRNRIRITRIVNGKQRVIKNVKPDDPVRPGDSVEVLSRLF